MQVKTTVRSPSAPLRMAISEMQVKTTMRSPSAPLRMAIIKIREQELGEDVEESGPYVLVMGM